MALFTLQDLTTPATREDVQASIYRVLAAVGVNTTAWGSGQVVRTIVVATAAVLASLSQLQARIAASGFAELSAGDWLTLVARHVYNVERIDATFASGALTLTNHGGGVYHVDADDFTVSNRVTGKTYRNTTEFDLAGGAGQKVTVPISATEAGSAGNAAVGELTEMVTTLLNVTCSNLSVLVGSDSETDAALRLRCREKLGALSPNGPWDAYAYAARTSKRRVISDDAVQYVTTGVTRTRVSRDGYGNVFLTVASDAGGLEGAIGDDTTDIGAVDAAVQSQAVPVCVTANVQSAAALTIEVEYRAYCYTTARRTDREIVGLIETALAAFFRALPIGGNTISGTYGDGVLYLDAIRTCIGGVLPEIFHVELILPVDDVTLAPTQVAVYEASADSRVQLVTPPEGSIAA